MKTLGYKYSPWKYEKTSSFLKFSGGTKIGHAFITILYIEKDAVQEQIKASFLDEKCKMLLWQPPNKTQKGVKTWNK